MKNNYSAEMTISSNADLRTRIYDTRAAQYVIGALMHKPLLLQDEKYALNVGLFVKPVHQMVFYAIANLASSGALRITEQDIDTEINKNSNKYSLYKRDSGSEFTKEAFNYTEGSDLVDFDAQYMRLQKLSMLRDLSTMGFNIAPYYNVDDITGAQDEQLEKMQLNTIPTLIREKLAEIENNHIGKDNGTVQEAGKGLRALIQGYKVAPEVGLPMDGQYLTAATRGARLGKMYLYSAPSGQGKTRFMISNACAISLPILDAHCNIVFPKYEMRKVLFIATEMSADEIQTLLVAHVSGVDEGNILTGNLTPEEDVRVSKAIDLIEEYSGNFIIECIADPSIELVRTRLIKHIMTDHTEFIYYDYIFSSPGLVTEFSSANIREDVALMMLANTLKEIAMTYQIHLVSATQLNDGWTKKMTGMRDQNCIRGSKAIADKVDVGLIGIRIQDEEMESIKPVWEELCRSKEECKNMPLPNVVVDVYKNRRGKLNFIKIWRYFDFSTCRATDLFITDANYNYLGVDLFQYEQENKIRVEKESVLELQMQRKENK